MEKDKNMSSKTIEKINKEKKFEKFETIVALPIPQKMALEGVVGLFQNNRYTVSIKIVNSDAFVGPDGNPSRLSHLTIIDKYGKGIPYVDRVRIKNELCGRNAEMVELYPGEWRDQVSWNHYHFWCLPIGAMFPLGFVPDNMEKSIMESGGAVGDNIGIKQEDLELYVISVSGIVEVFSDVEDAAQMYTDAGNDVVPDGEVIPLVNAPVEGAENVAWSLKARSKMLNIVGRYSNSIPEAMVSNILPSDESDNSGDPAIYENGPDMIEDSIVMPEEMRYGIEEKVRRRNEIVREASEAAAKGIESINDSIDTVDNISVK